MIDRSRLTVKRWVKRLLWAPSLIVVGCTMPGPSQDNGFGMPGAPGSPQIPGAPAPGFPGSGMVPPSPGYPPAAAYPASVPMTGAPMTGAPMTGAPMSATPMAGAHPAGAVAQVGFHQPFSRRPIFGHGQCEPCAPCAPNSYVMPPMGPWTGHDPQEYLCDGGDKPPAARLNRNDTVDGLQAEDTVVHYVTDDGDVEIQASNRACLYAPRFASVRRITGALAGGRAIGLRQVDNPVTAGRFDQELPGLVLTDSTELGHADVARRIDAMREQIRGVPVEGILQLQQTGDVLEALAALSLAELRVLEDEEQALVREHALAAITWELDESVEVVVDNLKVPTLTRDQQVQGFTIYDFPDAGRLQISKFADRSDAQPGDIVRFVLKVENVGDSTVSEVTLVDNLTTRLEYVDGSETSTREAVFEAIPNEGQSLRLKWRLKEPLKVGEEATIRFDCRVR